ncbi:MAG: DNA-processing protein DprA [Dermatophilaceae bacterium]
MSPGSPAAPTGRVNRHGIIDDRRARALLARLAEPGDERLARALASTEPSALVAGLIERRSGTLAEVLWPRFDRLGGVEGVPDDIGIAERLGARILTPDDREWPVGLNDLAVAPLCLWVRGPVDLAAVTRRSVAVVGARAATAYGIDRAGEIAAGLVTRGFTVVSGGAFGVDAAAHRGALAAEGVTVAVLACGIDRAYPLANAHLLSAIGRTGSIVTELPPGSAPYRARFLQRNRLIAAITGGVIVVEAALRSGSLQTAGRAADLGRPVGAVPGPVTSVASAGCHQAIRDLLAVLVTDAAEAAELVGDLGRDATVSPRGPESAADRLPRDQRQVWEVLPLAHPASVESLALRANLPERAVAAALGGLELAGLATRSEGRWRRP